MGGRGGLPSLGGGPPGGAGAGVPLRRPTGPGGAPVRASVWERAGLAGEHFRPAVRIGAGVVAGMVALGVPLAYAVARVSQSSGVPPYDLLRAAGWAIQARRAQRVPVNRGPWPPRR